MSGGGGKGGKGSSGDKRTRVRRSGGGVRGKHLKRRAEYESTAIYMHFSQQNWNMQVVVKRDINCMWRPSRVWCGVCVCVCMCVCVCVWWTEGREHFQGVRENTFFGCLHNSWIVTRTLIHQVVTWQLGFVLWPLTEQATTWKTQTYGKGVTGCRSNQDIHAIHIRNHWGSVQVFPRDLQPQLLWRDHVRSCEITWGLRGCNTSSSI